MPRYRSWSKRGCSEQQCGRREARGGRNLRVALGLTDQVPDEQLAIGILLFVLACDGVHLERGWRSDGHVT